MLKQVIGNHFISLIAINFSAEDSCIFSFGRDHDVVEDKRAAKQQIFRCRTVIAVISCYSIIKTESVSSGHNKILVASVSRIKRAKELTAIMSISCTVSEIRINCSLRAAFLVNKFREKVIGITLTVCGIYDLSRHDGKDHANRDQDC